MPDATVATPSDGAPKVFAVTDEAIKKLLDEQADANSKLWKDETDKLKKEFESSTEAKLAALKAELDKKAVTAPPDMSGVGTDQDPGGPGLTRKEIEKINQVRKLLPGGILPGGEIKAPLIEDVRAKYLSIDISTAPRGEVMDNWSSGRLCYAINQYRNGGADSIAKYAP